MIDIKDLKHLANQKENENYRFRHFLKIYADEEELDKQFKELHNKYFKIYDCKKCRNCCKEIGISMDENELNKICKYIKLDKNKYIQENLNKKYGEYTFKEKRCKFLDENNNCKVKECLPKSCKEYPYTDKEERLFSLYSVISNASVCPVVYEILEELKNIYIYNFK